MADFYPHPARGSKPWCQARLRKSQRLRLGLHWQSLDGGPRRYYHVEQVR
jgi:hypothetical protein